MTIHMAIHVNYATLHYTTAAALSSSHDRLAGGDFYSRPTTASQRSKWNGNQDSN
jgi:hypothetical protein